MRKFLQTLPKARFNYPNPVKQSALRRGASALEEAAIFLAVWPFSR